jgi:hypothetical protein
VRPMKRRIDFNRWKARLVSFQMTADRWEVGLFRSWKTPPRRPNKDLIPTSFHRLKVSRKLASADRQVLCVDRLFGAHGISHDTPAARSEFQLRMSLSWNPLRAGFTWRRLWTSTAAGSSKGTDYHILTLIFHR